MKLVALSNIAVNGKHVAQGDEFEVDSKQDFYYMINGGLAREVKEEENNQVAESKAKESKAAKK